MNAQMFILGFDRQWNVFVSWSTEIAWGHHHVSLINFLTNIDIIYCSQLLTRDNGRFTLAYRRTKCGLHVATLQPNHGLHTTTVREIIQAKSEMWWSSIGERVYPHSSEN